MKALRWIISHLVLLVLIWTAVYLYLDWDNVKHDLPEPVTEWVASLSKMVTAPAKVEHTEEAPAVAAVEVSPAQPEEEQIIVVEESSTKPESAEVMGAESESEPASETVSVNQATEESVTVQEADAPLVDFKQQLVSAREAFWSRDMETAIDDYKALVAAQPENPDLWGEMGNVYMAVNRPEEATAAYSRAADILIEQGSLQQVGKLIQIIGHFDQDAARDLYEKAMSRHPEHTSER